LGMMGYSSLLVAQPNVDFYENDDYCIECSDTTYYKVENDGRDTIWYEACDEPDPLDNPYNLVCKDLRVLIIIDRSRSIVEYGAVDDVKEGVMAFIGGLSCPDVKTAVLDFSTQARWIQKNYESTPTTQSRMDTYFQNEFNPDGNTNWNHAFYLANEIETPDLVLFFTDGNPTNWGWYGLGGGGQFDPFPNDCGSSGTTQPPEIINAIIEAN